MHKLESIQPPRDLMITHRATPSGLLPILEAVYINIDSKLSESKISF